MISKFINISRSKITFSILIYFSRVSFYSDNDIFFPELIIFFFFLTTLLSRMNFLVVVYDFIAFFPLFLLEIKLSSIDKLLSNCQWEVRTGRINLAHAIFLGTSARTYYNNKGKKKLGQVRK